ncbi:twin transmembrane helix small protein [Beijerinckia mobilis]|uniref:twin transmembrane helix small protein n=1 Tax=Beijerinckia mobilis TaxID=231434 RepID=UPI00054DCE12|nr:twin transmembrane helix small protein [Beijerinckia mobilis]
MSNPGNLLVGIGCGAVTIVLLLGLVNMLRGGSPNFSQKLMRWRIGLQFLTILIILGVLLFRQGA